MLLDSDSNTYPEPGTEIVPDSSTITLIEKLLITHPGIEFFQCAIRRRKMCLDYVYELFFIEDMSLVILCIKKIKGQIIIFDYNKKYLASIKRNHAKTEYVLHRDYKERYLLHFLYGKFEGRPSKQVITYYHRFEDGFELTEKFKRKLDKELYVLFGERTANRRNYINFRLYFPLNRNISAFEVYSVDENQVNIKFRNPFNLVEAIFFAFATWESTLPIKIY